MAHGGRARAGDQQKAIRRSRRQTKAGAYPGRGVQENIVEAGLGLAEHFAEGLRVDLFRGDIHGRGEQHQAGAQWVRRGLLQRIAPLAHVQKRQRLPVGQAQGDVQVAKPYVAVHAQHPPPFLGQSHGKPRAKGGLSRSPLPGHDRHRFAHDVSPPKPEFRNIIQEYRTKGKRIFRFSEILFIRIHKNFRSLLLCRRHGKIWESGRKKSCAPWRCAI